MEVTGTTIDLLFKGFNTKFNEFHAQVKTHWMDVEMKTSSGGSEEVYGWLSGLQQIREWPGSRVMSQMRTSDYVLKNKLFESTIRVPRTDIEDDKLGLYDARLRMMAHSAARHPDELVFSLLSKGFETKFYDGQNFFDTEHVYISAARKLLRSARIDGSDNEWA